MPTEFIPDLFVNTTGRQKAYLYWPQRLINTLL